MIAFLKKEDKEKDTELGGLRQDLKELHHETHKEREVLVQNYSDNVKSLDEQLKEKTQEVGITLFMTGWKRGGSKVRELDGLGGGSWRREYGEGDLETHKLHF